MFPAAAPCPAHKVKFIFAGHAKRNREARIRRPVMPPKKTPAISSDPRPTSTDSMEIDGGLPRAGGHGLEGEGVSEGANGGVGGKTDDRQQPDRVSAAATRGGADVGGPNSGDPYEGGSTTMVELGDSRTAGDVDSEDEPGTFTDNEVCCIF